MSVKFSLKGTFQSKIVYWIFPELIFLQVQFHSSVEGELEKVTIEFLRISGVIGTIYCALPPKDCYCSSHLAVRTVWIIKGFF